MMTILDILQKTFLVNNDNCYAYTEIDETTEKILQIKMPDLGKDVRKAPEIFKSLLSKELYEFLEIHNKGEKQQAVARIFIKNDPYDTVSEFPKRPFKRFLNEISKTDPHWFYIIKNNIDEFVKTSFYLKEYIALDRIGYDKNNKYPKSQIYNEVGKKGSLYVEESLKSILSSLACSFNENFSTEIGKRLGVNGIKADETNIVTLLTASIFFAIGDHCANNNTDIKESLRKNIISFYKNEETNITFSLINNNVTRLQTYIPRCDKNEELEKHITTDKKPIFITGDGGIGKTEFIANFICDHQVEYNFIFQRFSRDIKSTIASIPINNERTLFSKYDESGRVTLEDEDVIYEYKLSLLRECDEKTILVIDNFDAEDGNTLELLKDSTFEAVLKLPIKIILTTRADFLSIQQYTTVYMNEMSSENLLILMKQYENVKNNVSDDDLLYLIELVNSHTMTVDLIARTLNGDVFTQVSSKDMIKSLENCKYEEYDPVISTYNREYREKKILGHLETVFNVSGFTQSAKYIMSCASLTGIFGLNKKMFLNAIGENYKPDIMRLIKSGWLKSNASSILMHPLISIVCKKNNFTAPNYNDIYPFVNNFLNLRKNERDNTLKYSIETSKQVVSLLKEILNLLDDNSFDRIELYALMSDEYGNNIGNYQRSIRYLNKEMNLRKKLENQELEIAIINRKIGYLYMRLGNYHKSINYYGVAFNLLSALINSLSEDLDCFNKYRESVLESANICACSGDSFLNLLSLAPNVQSRQFAAQHALESYEHSLKLIQRIYNEPYHEIAYRYIDFANCLEILSQQSQARTYIENAINMLKSNKKTKNDIYLATAYSVLFRLNLNVNKASDALDNAQNELDVLLFHYPYEHFSLADTYYRIGNAYKHLSTPDYDKTIENWKKVIVCLKSRSKFPYIKNKLIGIYNNLADIFKLKGDYINALENHKNALEEMNKTLCDDIRKAMQYDIIGYDYGMLHDDLSALNSFEKALELYSKNQENSAEQISRIKENISSANKNLKIRFNKKQ